MNLSRKLLHRALPALFLVLFSISAFAEEEVLKKKTLGQLFEATGWVGYVMVVISIAGTAIYIENMVNIRREKLSPTALSEDLQALIDEEQYDQATELCDEEGGYLSHLIGSALRMRHAGYDEMIAGLEAAAQEEKFKLETKISYLSLVGNIAPLVGLLGTVTGMITAFQKIESMKAPTPGDLAEGVYESLVNTTLGLAIGITFLTLFFFMKNKVTKLALSINLQAVDLLKHLAGTGSGKH
jgi:biopolymer transport protein ExbB